MEAKPGRLGSERLYIRIMVQKTKIPVNGVV
jgi:hypothetical protein